MPRPLSIEAREKAIGATQEIVATEGISGFSIESVSRRSGVAKTTLYRHWSTASELLVHALDCNIATIATPNTGSLQSDLREILNQAMPVLNDDGTRRIMLDLLSAAAHDPELAVVNKAMIEERRRPISTVIELAISRGEIPPVELALAVDMVEGPFIARMLLRDGPVSDDDMTSMLDFVLRGLGA